MKRIKALVLPVASMIILSGCGEEKDNVLKTYNSFVSAIDAGDYSTAYQLTDAVNNPYMSTEVFEETLMAIGATYGKASKVKKADAGWEFTIGENTMIYSIVDNKLVLPNLYTELELYVPTGSECMYNNISLTDDLITYSNELETTYLLPNAPKGIGTLSISTELFGDSERLVDPETGDYNEYTLSDSMVAEVGDVIVKEITSINNVLETADTNVLVNTLRKYVADDAELRTLSEKLYSNRKLSDPFTSYTNTVYTVNNVNVDFITATTVEANVEFNVTWVIGENKTASMTTFGTYIIDRTINDWVITGIPDWEFMFLNATGG